MAARGRGGAGPTRCGAGVRVQPCEASPHRDIEAGQSWLLVVLGRIPRVRYVSGHISNIPKTK
jgi:hypothetical protein